jgi:hypothetical protein
MDSNPRESVAQPTRRRFLKSSGAVGASVAISSSAVAAQDGKTEPNPEPESRRGRVTQTSTLVGAVGASLGLGSVSASAQEDTTTDNASTTETERETVLASITETVTLVDYEVLEQTADRVVFEVVIESASPTQLVLSDVLGSATSQGVSQVAQSRRTITSGRTTATMEAGTLNESSAAIGVAVPGGAVSISTGISQSAEDTPLLWGIGAGGVGTLAAALGAARRKQTGGSSEPEQVDTDNGGLL